MAAATKGVFIVGAKRTAFGTFGGALKGLTATDLGVAASSAALASANVSPDLVDSVIVGNVAQTSHDTAYIARHIGLRTDVPIPVPALTVNRLCGSGFQSVVSAAHEILLGDASIVLAAGAESMTEAPHTVHGARWGAKLGVDLKLVDSLWATLTDSYTKLPMALTAEKLAEQYDISRQEVDDYALLTQQRFGAGQEAGRFDAEITPMTIKVRGKDVEFAVDEHPKPKTTPEDLAKLRPVFKKDGTVTAGNASGICDGAGALVVASEEAVAQNGLNPLARVVSWASVGVDPTIMGIGPVEAVKEALRRASLTIDDIDLFEVNEAFGTQYLAVEKALGLPREKTNVNGGAIAVGHPLAASGSRILAHLTHELRRTGGRYAVGSACIGGGQGIAVVIENTA